MVSRGFAAGCGEKGKAAHSWDGSPIRPTFDKLAPTMAKLKGTKRRTAAANKVAEGYRHPDQTLLMRPEVGTQAQFRKKKPPVTYRYDSSLSPALEWDGKNPARETGEALIKEIADGGLRIAELSKQPATPERDKQIENQKSKIKNEQPPERCHFCHADLPPLLADGQRPSPLCQRCGTALHSPQNRHLYCPSCGSDLRLIIVGDRRTLPICPSCEALLPPWPPPT